MVGKKHFQWMILLLLFTSPLDADEVFLRDGTSYTGVVLSQNETEIVFQVGKQWKVFQRESVQHLELWGVQRNAILQAKWKGKHIRQKLFLAFQEGPSGVFGFLNPYHLRLMRWVESTQVYQFCMKADFLQKYRKKNRAGFVVSIYCILLLLTAVVLRIIKEVVFLFLSLLGWNPEKK